MFIIFNYRSAKPVVERFQENISTAEAGGSILLFKIFNFNKPFFFFYVVKVIKNKNAYAFKIFDFKSILLFSLRSNSCKDLKSIEN